MTKVDILYMHVTDDEGVRDELGYIIEIHNMGMCTYKEIWPKIRVSIMQFVFFFFFFLDTRRNYTRKEKQTTKQGMGTLKLN